MAPPHREDAAALIDEIRRAGTAAHRTRVLLGMSGLWIMALMIPVLFLAITPLARWYHGPLSALFVGMGMASLAGCGAALPVPAGYRRVCRARLRRALRDLSPDELRAVLLPLRHETLPDTRMIVEPLLNEFHPDGCELAPARPPGGQGMEISAPTGETGSLPRCR